MSSRSLISNRTTNDDGSQSTIAEPTLFAMLSGTVEEASKACEALRRNLSHTPVTIDVNAAAIAVLNVLDRHHSALRVAHLCVAVLAHPALNAAGVAPETGFEPAVLRALDRLSMSAAFVHTALAALQNSASASAVRSRDTVLAAVVSAMRQHASHTGILLRGADLIAFHLNQQLSPPGASTFDICAAVVVSAALKLAVSPQGASAGLLALLAAARHSASSYSVPLPSSRFSRGVSGLTQSLVDQPFAAAVVAAMNRHKEFAPVQVLASELIKTAASGSSTAAKAAAREFFSAAALNALLIAVHVHQLDENVVNRALSAIRALLLLGSAGHHSRSPKPTIVLSANIAEAVITVTEKASVAMVHRNPEIAAYARVLSVDIRIAAASAASAHASAAAGMRGVRDSRSFSVVALGRRFARSLRMSRSSRGPMPMSGRPAFPQNTRPDKGYASGHVLGSTTSQSGNNMAQQYYPGSHHTFGGTNDRHSSSSRGKRVPSSGTAFTSVNANNGRRSHIPGASSSLVSRSTASVDAPPRRAKSGDRFDAPGVATGGVSVDRLHEGTESLSSSNDLGQSSVNHRWRSVGGRWYSKARRNASMGLPSTGSPGRRSRKDRRGPLTLSGSEVAHLTGQPSQVEFQYEGMGFKPQNHAVARATATHSVT